VYVLFYESLQLRTHAANFVRVILLRIIPFACTVGVVGRNVDENLVATRGYSDIFFTHLLDSYRIR
jgi:hypothetical protein